MPASRREFLAAAVAAPAHLDAFESNVPKVAVHLMAVARCSGRTARRTNARGVVSLSY